MASSAGGVWAIDIGNSALKALHLVRGEDGGLEVVGFDYVEHERILSSEGIDDEIRQRLVQNTLREFVSRNETADIEVAISIAGQNSFARFIKLPPVEKKRIPEIVQFEAVQQIPFDINEVEWDWQIMENQETEVGIFAIKNEIINGMMDHCTRENLKVACVQISPIALYNYAIADIQNIGGFDEKATVILDMGAENTTLVVCSKMGFWQRSIRIGGNAFTEAIADTFHLSFGKAEKLKRTAPMSKYMRQIFTAMKPVYTDLGSEIQRSLGFYSSSGAGREKGFARVIALGGGMKLQGMAKYLQQTLAIPVVKPDSFESLRLAGGVSAAKFHENVSDFGVVYGLGVQLLGEAKIKVNLLPRKVARAIAWRRKGKMFTVAACMLLFASILSLVKANIDKVQYNAHKTERMEIKNVIEIAQKAANDWEKQKARQKVLEERIQKQEAVFAYRDVIPAVNQTIVSCLPNKQNNPDQVQLYDAFAKGDVQAVVSVSRGQRKLLFVTSISVSYAPKLADASFDRAMSKRPVRTQAYSYDIRNEGRGSEMEYYDRRDMGMPGAYGLPQPGMGIGGAPAATEEGEGPGFVVIIEGYSPYSDIKELLDPHSVGNDQSKWGFITRLANLDKVIKGCRFELYKKNDIKHFELRNGPVDPMQKDTPLGIGIEKDIERVSMEVVAPPVRGGAYAYGRTTGTMRDRDIVYVEKVVVDPMTNEEMSKVFDIVTQNDIDSNPAYTEKDLGRRKRDEFDKPLYKERDYWFRLKAKFLWKGAPALPEIAPVGVPGGMDGYY
jgi:type IV pilus assembly protein PilM